MNLLLGFLLGIAGSILATVITTRWGRWAPEHRRRAVTISLAILVTAAAAYGVVAAIRAARDPAVLQVNVQARASGQGTWSSSVLARPGDVVSFRLLLKNPGPGQTRVIARINQAPSHSFVCGSVQKFTRRHSPGEFVTGTPRDCSGVGLIERRGLAVGRLAEDATVTLQWEARISRDPPRGTRLYTVGIGRGEGQNEVYNTADVTVEPES